RAEVMKAVRHCGSAAPQCGKAQPFRRESQSQSREAMPRAGGAASYFSSKRDGKAKPYRVAGRQSRKIIFIFSLFIFAVVMIIIPHTRSSSKGLAMPVQGEKIRAPELSGARGWLNTDKPLTLSALKGK